ncbi:unnamed protein product [Strongylus vulgaris]|uniref:Histone-lysine N-methyltransferase, H3 lysine-79 specific n=1 Tax=Strongylus vulgaris TaxID=40348 RepID=A0A3P7JL06_STRVU|nr:unnamed protein product [Strongylus vulgaris]
MCVKRLPCALPTIFAHLDNGASTFTNVDKSNLEEVRAVIEDFNKVAAPYAKLWKGQTNPAFESWSQDRADVELLTIICSLSFSRAVSNPQLLNNHYAPFSSGVKRSVGIEINDLPARYGSAMGEDFSKWMKWWKKKCRPFQLIHGDMLDEQYRNMITQVKQMTFFSLSLSK